MSDNFLKVFSKRNKKSTCSALVKIFLCVYTQHDHSKHTELVSSSEWIFFYMSSCSLQLEVRICVTVAYYNDVSLCYGYELCNTQIAQSTIYDCDSTVEICGILFPVPIQFKILQQRCCVQLEDLIGTGVSFS